MRILITLMVVLGIVLQSCRKETELSSIYKQWHWENSVGGFTGSDTIWPANNNTVILILNRDNSYTTKVNGQSTSQGYFTISKIDNQQVFQAENFTTVGGLWLGINGMVINVENNKLHMTGYNVSEPYTHNFR